MDLLASYSDESSKHSPNPLGNPAGKLIAESLKTVNNFPTLDKMTSSDKAKSLEEEWASFEKLIEGEMMADSTHEAGDSGKSIKQKLSETAGTSESYAFEIQSSSSSSRSSSRSNSPEPVKTSKSKSPAKKSSVSDLPSHFRPKKDSGKGSSTSRSRSRSHSPKRSKKSKDKRSRSHSRDRSRSRSRERRKEKKPQSKKEKRRHRSSSRNRRSRSRSRKRSTSRHRSPHSKRSRSRSRDRKRDKKSHRDHHRNRSKDRSHRRRKHSSPRRRSRSKTPKRRSRSKSPRRRRSRTRSPRRRSRSRSFSPRRYNDVPVDSYQKKLMGTLAKTTKPLSFREKMRQDLLKASKLLSDQADKGLLMDDAGKEKLKNIAVTSAESSNVTPQMALLQTMAAMHQKAQEMTGVSVPKYYNPAAVNPLKYAEQYQKRKLLWSKNKEKKEEKPGDHWQATAFQADSDGKTAAKFRKLMGMKEEDPGADDALTEEQRRKREELFNRLDKDYEFARMSTHTHRGVGLGFASQGMSMPQFPQP